MGFPIVTVTEKADSIHIRQDRFLETGPAKEEDNQTVWYDFSCSSDMTFLKDPHKGKFL